MAVLIGSVSCERPYSDDIEFARYSDNGDVYIDGFSTGLQYFPFAGSKLDAFSVDTDVKYEGSSSMRFDVPNFGDPEGAYAGAIFPTSTPRDLSGYDALTFYAKATKAATINEIGFGNDFGENKYVVTKNNLRITTNWVKYIIPIPDPDKLIGERGMFWYAEGPEDNDGYTFWVDEIKFEKLGTVAQPRPAIFNGQDIEQLAFINVDIPITGLTQTFNLASGVNQTVNAAPSYYTFMSSNTDVAVVNEQGIISPVGIGSAEITALLGGVKAAGSMNLMVTGSFELAPTPTRDPANVISIYSDAYNNINVDFYNGFFEPFQTTLGGDNINVNGNRIINYTNFNFVGIQFGLVDVSAMTSLHLDILIPEDISLTGNDYVEVELQDYGADASPGGGDDAVSRVRIESSRLSSGEWASIDIPLSNFSSLSRRTNMGLLLFDSSANITEILVDNIYFYKE
ncbi:glycosyl hydrolase family 16 [Salinimicrobium soli]|uniref:glycosyl hydrolase family 16 n=1 Tax=Salinimicrobium soli TaxID=1254399 RepID=UPI003AB063D5